MLKALVPQNAVRREMWATMIAKGTKRRELERGVRHRRLDMRESSSATARAPRCTRSGLSIAYVGAHHAVIRSSSHSSMKTENWFQLRIVGVTTIVPPESRAAFVGQRGQQVV